MKSIDEEVLHSDQKPLSVETTEPSSSEITDATKQTGEEEHL